MKLIVKDYVIEGSLEEIISAIFAIDKRFRDQNSPLTSNNEPAKVYKFQGSKATKNMHIDTEKVVSYEEQFLKILFDYSTKTPGVQSSARRIAQVLFDRKPHVAKTVLFNTEISRRMNDTHNWRKNDLPKAIRYLKRAGCKFEIQNRDSNDILIHTDKSIYPNTVVRLTTFGTLAQAKAARKERSEKTRLYTKTYNDKLAKKKKKTAVKQPVSSEVTQLLNQ